MLPPPPRSTLFPYTTLFRSRPERFDLAVPRAEPVGEESVAGRCVSAHKTPERGLRLDSLRVVELGPRVLAAQDPVGRSEEHTSELQSRLHLVCRLLLEKKKK